MAHDNSLYLSAGTPSETQFINDPLHSLLPFCMCHLRGQTKGCREVEVLPNRQCAHHDIILAAVLEYDVTKMCNNFVRRHICTGMQVV